MIAMATLSASVTGTTRRYPLRSEKDGSATNFFVVFFFFAENGEIMITKQKKEVRIIE